jgi:hypothetical protein
MLWIRKTFPSKINEPPRKVALTHGVPMAMSTDTLAQNSYNFDAAILLLPDGAASGLIYIEQLAANDECNIPNRPWMVAQNANTKMAIFFKPTCKLWSCPYCAKVNAGRWIIRGFNGTQALLAEGWRTDFVTITSHERLTPAMSFRVLPLAWPKLYRRYKRAVSKDDPKAFIAVPERQPKSGKAHAHLIITGGLSKRWWKDNARECGLGYQSDVKDANLGAAGYLAKYLGKTLEEKWPKGKRRVNTSRNWPQLPDMPAKPGWKFATQATDAKLSPVLGVLSANGYTVMGVTTTNAWRLLDDLSPEFSTPEN